MAVVQPYNWKRLYWTPYCDSEKKNSKIRLTYVTTYEQVPNMNALR